MSQEPYIQDLKIAVDKAYEVSTLYRTLFNSEEKTIIADDTDHNTIKTAILNEVQKKIDDKSIVGEDGKNISDISLDSEGKIIVMFNDGTALTSNVAKGLDGITVDGIRMSADKSLYQTVDNKETLLGSFPITEGMIATAARINGRNLILVYEDGKEVNLGDISRFGGNRVFKSLNFNEYNQSLTITFDNLGAEDKDIYNNLGAKDGKDAVVIMSASMDSTRRVTLVLKNGKVIDAGIAKSKTTPAPNTNVMKLSFDSQGRLNATNNFNTFVIGYIDGVNGRDGYDGRNGIDANDGINASYPTSVETTKDTAVIKNSNNVGYEIRNIKSVDASNIPFSNAKIDDTGELVFVFGYNEDAVLGMGRVKGYDGKKGDSGVPAVDGTDGIDGTDGEDGIDGISITDITLDDGVLSFTYSGDTEPTKTSIPVNVYPDTTSQDTQYRLEFKMSDESTITTNKPIKGTNGTRGVYPTSVSVNGTKVTLNMNDNSTLDLGDIYTTSKAAIELNDRDFVMTLDNGTKQTVADVVGDKGKDGPSITAIRQENGNIIATLNQTDMILGSIKRVTGGTVDDEGTLHINFNDNTGEEFYNIKGEVGDIGRDGLNGINRPIVTKVAIDEKKDLIFTFDNNTVINGGNMRGFDGVYVNAMNKDANTRLVVSYSNDTTSTFDYLDGKELKSYQVTNGNMIVSDNRNIKSTLPIARAYTSLNVTDSSISLVTSKETVQTPLIKKGKDANSIKKVSPVNDTLVLTLDDNTTITVPGKGGSYISNATITPERKASITLNGDKTLITPEDVIGKDGINLTTIEVTDTDFLFNFDNNTQLKAAIPTRINGKNLVRATYTANTIVLGFDDDSTITLDFTKLAVQIYRDAKQYNKLDSVVDVNNIYVAVMDTKGSKPSNEMGMWEVIQTNSDIMYIRKPTPIVFGVIPTNTPIVTASEYAPLYSLDKFTSRKFQVCKSDSNFNNSVIDVTSSVYIMQLPKLSNGDYLLRTKDISDVYESKWSVPIPFTVGDDAQVLGLSISNVDSNGMISDMPKLRTTFSGGKLYYWYIYDSQNSLVYSTTSTNNGLNLGYGILRNNTTYTFYCFATTDTTTTRLENVSYRTIPVFLMSSLTKLSIYPGTEKSPSPTIINDDSPIKPYENIFPSTNMVMNYVLTWTDENGYNNNVEYTSTDTKTFSLPVLISGIEYSVSAYYTSNRLQTTNTPGNVLKITPKYFMSTPALSVSGNTATLKIDRIENETHFYTTWRVLNSSGELLLTESDARYFTSYTPTGLTTGTYQIQAKANGIFIETPWSNPVTITIP